MAQDFTTKLSQLVQGIYWNGSGLGVGTTSISHMLEVNGTAAISSTLTVAAAVVAAGSFITARNTPGSGAGLELYYASNISGLMSYDRTGAAYKAMAYDALTHTFSVSGTSTAIIGSSGLGIGMTPSNVLDITQSTTGIAKVNLLNNNSGTGASTAYWAQNGTATLQMRMFGASYTTSGVFRQNGGMLTSDGAGGLTLNTEVNQPIYFGVNSTEVGRWTSTGLGINTTSITHALEVNGTAAISGALTLSAAFTYGGVTLSNSVTGTGSLVLSSAPSFAGVVNFSNGNGGSYININNTTNSKLFQIENNSGAINFYTNANVPMQFFTNSTLAGGFGSDGSFLVGTTTNGGWSTGAKLEAKATGSSSALAGYAVGNAGGGNAILLRLDNTSGTLVNMFYGTTNVGAITTDGTAAKLGLGMTPSNILDITQNQNASSRVALLNNDGGGAAQSFFQAKNGTAVANFGIHGTGFTTSGIESANMAYMTGSSTVAVFSALASPLLFGINSSEVARFDTSGNFLIASASNANVKLSVFAGSSASAIAQFDSTNAYNASGTGIRISSSATTQLWVGYGTFASNMGSSASDAGLGARNWLLLDGASGIKQGVNGVEKSRLDSSGNFLVGTTSASGSLSNAASVMGGIFSTFKGSATVPNGGNTVTVTGLSPGSTYLVTWNLNSDAAGVGTWISGNPNLGPQQKEIDSGHYYTGTVSVTFTSSGFGYSPSTSGNCVFTCGNSTGGTVTLYYTFTRIA